MTYLFFRQIYLTTDAVGRQGTHGPVARTPVFKTGAFNVLNEVCCKLTC